ncbi:MAG: S-methyl-5-thioribose-1-phosphate isomerase [Candidatus Eutrophobiaceae bacterium]
MDISKLVEFHEFHAIEWHGGHLHLLDQRTLPERHSILKITTLDAAILAIRTMVVRGAPAIGIAAGYACVLAGREAWSVHGAHWRVPLEKNLRKLEQARPTAINLMWAVQRMRAIAEACPEEASPEQALLIDALNLHREDRAANLALAKHGADFIEQQQTAAHCSVLTHCNAGALATGGYGTALGVIRQLHERGRLAQVYISETRPLRQGARLTAWELAHLGISATLIVDGASAALMSQGKVDWIIVGADRITARGDAVNKIGTLTHAAVARHYGARVMVAAPSSTVDMAIEYGKDVPIECRLNEEITHWEGKRHCVEEVNVWNPAFDITPAELVDAIVTERGATPASDLRRLMAMPSPL